MNDKMKELMEKKEQILKQLEEVHNSVTKEDIEGATVAEKAEYVKLTLEIQQKLKMIEILEEAINNSK